MDAPKVPLRLCLGVALCALATVILELALTRIFSAVLFYHFAFMAISVALFGLGAGGLYAYRLERAYRLEKRNDGPSIWERLGRLSTINGLIVVAALWTILEHPLVNEATWSNALRLVPIYLVCAFPFLIAGTAISAAIAHSAKQVSRVYFYDLLGAAVGCILLIPLLDNLGAPGAVIMAGGLYAAAGVLWHTMDGWSRKAWRSSIVAAILFACAFMNPSLHLIDIKYSKGISKSMEEFSQWNSFSRVSVGQMNGGPMILIDSGANTAIADFSFDDPDDPRLDTLLLEGPSLPYSVHPNAKTMIIGAGGGRDVARAIAGGSKDVTAVDINPIIVEDIMKGAYAEASRGLYFRPEVRTVVEDGRTFARRSKESYDVIQMTLVDSWASTAAGAYALAENHLYTTEAFSDFLKRLSDDGLLSVSRWEFAEPRESLRVVSIAMAALADLGVNNPGQHIFIARENEAALDGWGAQDTILIKRTPFSPLELAAAHDLVDRADIGVVYAPDRDHANPFTDLLRATDPELFIAGYPFDISPATDNRPFFFYTIPLTKLIEALKSPGNAEIQINLGLMLLLASLGIAIVGVIAVMALPPVLLKEQLPRGKALWTSLGFFFSIGAAFILVEIALAQRIVFFLGRPTYALTVVIFSLLLASSLGSYFSKRIVADDDRRLKLVLAGAAAAVTVLVGVAPGVLDLTLSRPLAVKFAVLAAMIFPAGFLMGIPFPSGIARLERELPNAVCWAWAVNAAANVLGSVGALFLGIHFGLAQSALVGGALYLAAAATVTTTRERRGEERSAEHDHVDDLARLGQSVAAGASTVKPEQLDEESKPVASPPR